MIYGIGVDTATIARLEKSMASESFVQRVFGAAERAYFENIQYRSESVAAAFAAKEAFGKALGTGLSGFAWNEVETLHNEQGAPYLSFSGAAADLMREKSLHAHLSLTHEGGFATAFVILEKE